MVTVQSDWLGLVLSFFLTECTFLNVQCPFLGPLCYINEQNCVYTNATRLKKAHQRHTGTANNIIELQQKKMWPLTRVLLRKTTAIFGGSLSLGWDHEGQTKAEGTSGWKSAAGDGPKGWAEMRNREVRIRGVEANRKCCRCNSSQHFWDEVERKRERSGQMRMAKAGLGRVGFFFFFFCCEEI